MIHCEYFTIDSVIEKCDWEISLLHQRMRPPGKSGPLPAYSRIIPESSQIDKLTVRKQFIELQFNFLFRIVNDYTRYKRRERRIQVKLGAILYSFSMDPSGSLI